MSGEVNHEARALLDVAESIVSRPDRMTTGAWSRSAVLLIRQSLEASLAALWARTSPGMALTSMRVQLICLPEYLRKGDLAGEVAATWGGLSSACHSHAYELAPTVEEVTRWLAVARELAD